MFGEKWKKKKYKYTHQYLSNVVTNFKKIHFIVLNNKKMVQHIIQKYKVITRPGVAGAVLLRPLSFLDSIINYFNN